MKKQNIQVPSALIIYILTSQTEQKKVWGGHMIKYIIRKLVCDVISLNKITNLSLPNAILSNILKNEKA